jgi:hypothetical protein
MLPLDSGSVQTPVYRSPLTCIERTRSLTAFALSSPVFTKEDEEAEWNSLSQAEQELIFQDLHGFHSNQGQDDGVDESTSLTSEKTDDDVEERVNHFILTKISFPANEAYMKVLEQNPVLLKTESNTRDFLRCENNNLERAAHRIVNYWAVRREVIGYGRYHLPLSLDGAMATDIGNLARGFAYVSANRDSSERPVVFFDRIRSAKSVVDRDTLCRCLFYVLNAAATQANTKRSEDCACQKSNKGCRSSGVVLLGNYRVSPCGECFPIEVCFLTSAARRTTWLSILIAH